MTGRADPLDKDYVFCWCGRIQVYASFKDIRTGTPQYCGISCSSYKPLAYQARRGRPKKYDSNGNKIVR